MSTIKVNNIDPPNVGEGVSIDGLQMPTAGPLSNRNLIQNGAMTVAQRGTSETGVTTIGYKSVDRFLTVLNTLGTWTVSQETDAPDGFKYSLKHTCTTADSSPVASDYALIYQRIETQNIAPQIGYGTSSAKDLTLSFWVKSNKTGDASVGIFYTIGTNVFNDVQYTINSANTWEYKTVTFAPNSIANAAADNETGMTVEWWMHSGSDFSGTAATGWNNDGPQRNSSNIGIGGAVNDYFQITGVQLEVGSKATPFEHRSYSDELLRCSRYFVSANWQFCAKISGIGYRHKPPGPGVVQRTAADMSYFHPVTGVENQCREHSSGTARTIDDSGDANSNAAGSTNYFGTDTTPTYDVHVKAHYDAEL